MTFVASQPKFTLDTAYILHYLFYATYFINITIYHKTLQNDYNLIRIRDVGIFNIDIEVFLEKTLFP